MADEAVVEVCRRAMKRQPAERYLSAVDFAEALEDYFGEGYDFSEVRRSVSERSGSVPYLSMRSWLVTTFSGTYMPVPRMYAFGIEALLFEPLDWLESLPL